MASINLTNEKQSLIVEKDNIAIVDVLQTIRGGKALYVTGFTPAIIKAGHVIIRATTGSKDYKPMPLNAGATAYAALPADHEYAGILIASIPTNKAAAGIMLRGTVNPAACPFPLTAILADVKTALPLILFRED